MNWTGKVENQRRAFETEKIHSRAYKELQRLLLVRLMRALREPSVSPAKLLARGPQAFPCHLATPGPSRSHFPGQVARASAGPQAGEVLTHHSLHLSQSPLRWHAGSPQSGGRGRKWPVPVRKASCPQAWHDPGENLGRCRMVF